MSEIKAIETIYNGYRFRSRLEARWAVFFDELEIKYQYEPEGFDLGDGYYYLPDFYLTDDDVWVEIKGKALTDEEREKIERFCIAKCDLPNGGSKFRLLEGEVPKEPFVIPAAEDKDDVVGVFSFMYASPTEIQHVVKFIKGMDVELPSHGALLGAVWVRGAKSWTFENVKRGLLKARQARFEHGETPTIGGNK